MKLPTSDSFTVMGIDQSLSATGISALNVDPAGKLSQIESKTIYSKLDGIARLDEIIESILDFAYQHSPALVCMEDVTRMASSASIIPLTELYAVIKYRVWKSGLQLRIQNQSQMKKFNFGQGDVSKDSAYMLKVFDATGLRFIDDNSADAYMHAVLGANVILFLKGTKLLTDFTGKQQEVLLADALKKSKMTQGKFKKLTSEDKMKLVLEHALA